MFELIGRFLIQDITTTREGHSLFFPAIYNTKEERRKKQTNANDMFFLLIGLKSCCYHTTGFHCAFF